MVEIVTTKIISWAGSLMITLGIVLNWGSWKAAILFILALLVAFLKIIHVIVLIKSDANNEKIKDSAIYKFLVFFKIFK